MSIADNSPPNNAVGDSVPTWNEVVEAVEAPAMEWVDEKPALWSLAERDPETGVVIRVWGLCIDCGSRLDSGIGSFGPAWWDVAHAAYTMPGDVRGQRTIIVLPFANPVSGDDLTQVHSWAEAWMGAADPAVGDSWRFVPAPARWAGYQRLVHRGPFLDPMSLLRSNPPNILGDDDDLAPSRFPASAWTGLFGDYRRLVADTTEAPHCFHWGALAAALSVLVGRDAVLGWGTGEMVPVVHVCVVGPTAKARKSTALDDVVETVVEPLRPLATQPYEPDPMEIVVGVGTGEGFAEAIADRTWWPSGKSGKGDPNVQKGRRALFVQHELGGLLEKADRGQAGNMLDFLIRTFDAPRTWSHRTRNKSKTSPALEMTEAVGVFMAATTMEWLEKTMTETQVMAGLANRFLWLTGKPSAPLAIRPSVNQADIIAFQKKVEDALRRARGVNFSLSHEARLFHEAKYRERYRQSAPSEIVAAATAREDVLALRVAMLLAVADGSARVGVSHIAAAWAVVGYSNCSVQRVVERLSARSMREAQDRVEAAITRHIASSGNRFRRRDIYQRVKGRSGMSAEMFNRVFASLLEAEVIRPPEEGHYVYDPR